MSPSGYPAAGRSDWLGLLAGRPHLVVAAAALVLMALNPVGYVGGGWDDYYYLEAARCAADHGYCLPAEHWARRFTFVAPLGWSIALLGDSREALWLVPAAYSLTALALLVVVVRRAFGPVAALLAGLALVLTPAFGERMLHLGVDIAELTFALAALACLQGRARAGSAAWPLAAGALLALAVLTRPTALALLPLFAGGIVLARARWTFLALFGLGFVAPIAAEAAIYGALAGDPFLPWTLSLAHATIPSTELRSGVDLSRSPLFNPAFIGGWRPAAGIEVHWTVDALVNLFAHRATSFTLLGAIALLLINGRRLGTPAAGGAAFPLLVLAAALYFGALVYAFAIDPKPRMFLPVMAVAAVAIGVLAPLAWQGGRKLLPAILGVVLAVNGVAMAMRQPDVKPFDTAAPAFLERVRGPLTVDESTRRLLALEPRAMALPAHRAGDRRPVLIASRSDCAVASASLGGRWTVAREASAGSGGRLCVLAPLAPAGEPAGQHQQLDGQ
jgi:4-amino-4-deoxy-L-arabinose transferase-like glycosyltransferase